MDAGFKSVIFNIWKDDNSATLLIVGLLSLALLAVVLESSKLLGGAKIKSIGWRPIPQPRPYPLLGNLLSLDVRRPIQSMLSIANEPRFSDIYRLNLPGISLVVVNSQKLVNEICNEKLFRKEPLGPLLEARNGAGDSLFTAYTEEENWGIAHRLIMPHLGPSAVRDMFDNMHEITTQLVHRWETRQVSHAFNPIDDFNRLSLDTIGLCALGIRFDSFKTEDIHPFAPAMTYFLDESGRRAMRPAVAHNTVFRARTSKYWQCIRQLHSTPREAIQDRRGDKVTREDIMNVMMNSVDPKTGKVLPVQGVINNTLALIGAGTETTAGLLSFLIVLLAQHPACMSKARDEIKTHVNSVPLSKEHLPKLTYLSACIRETLRLYPSAPGFQLKLRPDVVSSGLGTENFKVTTEDIITVNLLALHRDKAVWGDDAETFKPERMLSDDTREIPRNAWKPFGNGIRSCIGQSFALQEILIVITTLVRNFDIQLADPNYKIAFTEALTLWPDGLMIKVQRQDLI